MIISIEILLYFLVSFVLYSMIGIFNSVIIFINSLGVCLVNFSLVML